MKVLSCYYCVLSTTRAAANRATQVFSNSFVKPNVSVLETLRQESLFTPFLHNPSSTSLQFALVSINAPTATRLNYRVYTE